VIAGHPHEASETWRERFENEAQISLRFADVTSEDEPGVTIACDLLHEGPILWLPYMEIADREDAHA
jgi:hypothetical protein